MSASRILRQHSLSSALFSGPNGSFLPQKSLNRSKTLSPQRTGLNSLQVPLFRLKRRNRSKRLFGLQTTTRSRCLLSLPEKISDMVGQHRVCRGQDRKSTRLNSSHVSISYAVFCLK